MTDQDFSNTFRVGKYTCTITVRSPERGKVGVSEAAWSPEIPPHGSFNSHMMVQYRDGRDALAAEVARALGGGNALISVERRNVGHDRIRLYCCSHRKQTPS